MTDSTQKEFNNKKVILNEKQCFESNTKRNKWVAQNLDKVFTAKIARSNLGWVYFLEEDPNDPKWLFFASDLILVEEEHDNVEGA